MIDKLRKRAKTLRIQGMFLIFFVGCLMVAAGWLFFNASDIAAKDIRAPDASLFKKDLLIVERKINKIVNFIPTSELKETIEITKKYLADALADLNEGLFHDDEGRIQNGYMSVTGLNSQNSLLRFIGIDVKLKPIPREITIVASDISALIVPVIQVFHKNKIKSYIEKNNKTYEDVKLVTNKLRKLWDLELGKVLNKYEKNKAKLKEYLNRKENLEKLIIMAENYKLAIQYDFDIEGLPEKKVIKKSENQLLFVISTNIIRFGPMLIIFFFSRVLLGLYKYSVRLASYYDARADALELIATDFDHKKYNSWVNTLSPDAYDIGANNGKPPADQIIDIFKIIMQKDK